jgi:MerR family copper efflux transcriptional regulator
MLISEFARATGLSRDTVRFYVRRGLLKPLAGNKGGSNPYQVFTGEHVQLARLIRMAQSLGFSLREIVSLNAEYQAKRITPARGAEIMRAQHARLEEKAAHVGGMISYIRAKLAWLEAGGKGPEPNFTDYERTPRRRGANRRRRTARKWRWRGGPCANTPPLKRRRLGSQISGRTVAAILDLIDQSEASAGHNCLFHCALHPAKVLPLAYGITD